MARFRMVHLNIWGDERFRRLSPIQPSGQGLWWYLLTCPFHSRLPGVLLIGEAGLAEALRWPVRSLKQRLAELTDEGMVKVDTANRLIWLVNGLKYGAPANASVVLGWRDGWRQVPECSLKDEIRQHFVTTLRGRYDAALAAVFGPIDGHGVLHGVPHGGGDGVPHGGGHQPVTILEGEVEGQGEAEEYPPTPQGGEVGSPSQENESPKEGKKDLAPVVIPDTLNNPAFAEAWARWLAYRTEIRKPLKPTSLNAQLKKLAGWGATEAVASIDDSITNGWQGLFEPKAPGSARGPAQSSRAGRLEAPPGKYDHLDRGDNPS